MIRIVLYSGEPWLTETDLSNSSWLWTCVFESTSLYYSSWHLPGVFTEVTWNVLFLQFKIVTAQQMIIVCPNLSQNHVTCSGQLCSHLQQCNWIYWSGILVILLFVLLTLQADQAEQTLTSVVTCTELACMHACPEMGTAWPWPRLIDLGLVTFIQSTYWIATSDLNWLYIIMLGLRTTVWRSTSDHTSMHEASYIYCNGTNKQIIIHDGMLIVLWVHTEKFWASNIFQIPATGNLTLG